MNNALTTYINENEDIPVSTRIFKNGGAMLRFGTVANGITLHAGSREELFTIVSKAMIELSTTVQDDD